MNGSASDIKSRNFSRCAQAHDEPMSAKKAGQIACAISFEKQHQSARAAREKVLENEFGNWLALQNARFEATGAPGADLRPW